MRYFTIGVVKVKRETDLAFLFELESSELWVPKSVIEEPDDVAVDDEDIEVNVKTWFAEKEGLE